MPNIIKHKRRNTGASGPPSSLASGEFAFNEVDGTGLMVGYYGFGDNGSGLATSILPIFGPGATVFLSGNQNVSGIKTFTSTPVVPTLGPTDTSTGVANAAFVQSQFPAVTAGTYPKVTVTTKGLVSSGGPLVAADIPSLTASKITDFDTQVRTSRLDQMAAPTAAFSFNNQLVTGVPDPISASGIASKNYVDSVAQGLDAKASVRVATTSSLSANVRSGNVLTASSNGALVIDSVTLTTTTPPTRILVKDETTQANNGIFDVTNAGSSSTPYILTRSSDFDTWSEVPGAFVFVEEGTVNSDTGWISTGNTGGTINSTTIAFTQFSSAGVITNGDGLAKSGNVLSVLGTANRISVTSSGVDIASTYAGQASITTLGTLATGTWRASVIEIAYGGTGANLTSVATNAMIKKVSATALGAAVAGTDYLDPNSTVDGGTF